MKKRGSMLVFIAVITLLVALLVGVFLPMIAETYASQKAALKAAACRDIALILDTMYAYPYDFEMDYDYDLSSFVVNISQNKVRIYDPSFDILTEDPTRAEYPFIPVDDDPSFKLYNPQNIHFTKVNRVLTVTG